MCAPMSTEDSRTMFIPGQPFWPFRLEIPHNLSLLFLNKPLYLYLSITAATSKVVAEKKEKILGYVQNLGVPDFEEK